MVGEIIGTQHVASIHLFFGPSNTEFGLSVPIISGPSVETCCVILFLFEMSRASCAVLGQGTPLPSSSWSSFEQEGKCREHFELLFHVTLYLLLNDGIRIGTDK